MKLKRKAGSGVVLMLLLISMLTLAFNIPPVSTTSTQFAGRRFDYYGEDIPQKEIADVARTYPYYDYEDEIREVSITSLFVINLTCKVHNFNTGLNYTTIQEAINAPETLDGHTIFVEEGTYCEHVVVHKSVSLIGENRTGTVIDGNGTDTLMRIAANSVFISRFTFCNSGHNYTDCSILIENSRGNNLANNIIVNNLYGVRLVNSTNNRLTDNVASENAVAVYLWNSSYNQITRNHIGFVNNSGIALWQGSANNIIQHNSISRSNCTAIYTNNSNNNTIAFNNLSLNEGGIYLRESSCNILTDNNITFGTLTGLALRNITNSKIYLNTITHNSYGIYSANISNNLFAGNTIADNEYGVRLKHSHNNVFNCNNFINNYLQVTVLYSYSNSWDNDLEGNYWSDYTVRYPLLKDEYQGENQDILGSDGIWDSPYEIDVDNQDNYPFVEPWSPLPKTIGELKTEIEKCWSEGEIDNQGIVRSLMAKLNVAQKLVAKRKIDESKTILQKDFIPQVQNLSGIHITIETADILVKSAEYILSNL